ncbi:MAG: phosphonate C-P lyase system protein PhnH [Deltaproteobacteria bacterium]|jgi:alpha-D-ribose 1-methylphosphonate 5-triphosphate synthase subunit PhnH|nr:phosphonate C-P lyase system protein PhnH [Deltaproteobacteria bacterium]
MKTNQEQKKAKPIAGGQGPAQTGSYQAEPDGPETKGFETKGPKTKEFASGQNGKAQTTKTQSGGAAPALGFGDYTLASQGVFRLALSAMASPTKRFYFDFKSLIKSQPPIPIGIAALALTLADHLTPLWLSPSLAQAEGFLVFHSSAPIVREPEKADFVLAANLGEMPNLGDLNQGDPRYPDRAATVILGGAFEKDDPGVGLTAFGPGLEGETEFENHGLSRDFVGQWALNRACYPLGVDVFLAGGDCLAALPRSLTLRLKPS